MPATAILFPGQGSHTDGMREQVAYVRPDLLEGVEKTLGEDPFPRVGDGTNFAQPAIFCASLAGWEALGKPHGDFMAGHSLGELAALVAAGTEGLAVSRREGFTHSHAPIALGYAGVTSRAPRTGGHLGPPRFRARART